LQTWVDAAWAQANVPNPNAMTLCTVGSDGAPSARIVLLKGLDEHGAVFFTNRQSPKGHDLAGDSRVALVLHWDHMGRQVRIEGSVTDTTEAESDAYFASRHLQSRLGAWASDQSKPCDNRAELLQRLEAAQGHCGDPANPDRPPQWGGYRVSLQVIEFWQAGEHRLHDRVRYERRDEGWTSQRLFP
jgi:pyridoxamine 5'-phosphate oxidase